MSHVQASRHDMRVLLLGASGSAGQGALRGLLRAGHEVVCVVRKPLSAQGAGEVRLCNLDDPDALSADALKNDTFDAVVSCLASRTGTPEDAWKVDYGIHMRLLPVFQAAGIGQFVLLSAICVQKPQLAFQHAKLAFEQRLMACGMRYSIVRATALFKSLCGQFERVRAGKPLLVFGDGRQTHCKPISDDDLGDYMALCLEDSALHNRILPIGGPGPAISPLDQANMMGEALGRKVKTRSVPVVVLDGIIAGSTAMGWISKNWDERANLARIGRYYATQSMLVWDATAGRYDRDATPEFGHRTLAEHYTDLAQSGVSNHLGEHAVFSGS